MLDSHSVFDELELWTGQATEHHARVYAQLPRRESDGQAKLTGTLLGPISELGQTLPATYRFRDLGPGPTALAECVVPDPCYWFPGEPYRYQLALGIESEGELHTYQQEFAVRPMAATERDFRLSRKRWVPRGIRSKKFDPGQSAEWLSLAGMPFINPPSDQLLVESLQYGLPLCIDCTLESERSHADLIRWSRYPSVVAAIGGFPDPLPFKKPHLLFGQVTNPDRNWSVARWADFMMVNPDDLPQILAADFGRRIPIVVNQDIQTESLADSRAACDLLQRDVARWGDFAGYFVNPIGQSIDLGG